MAEQYYQSAYTGEQIDESIGRIVNGEIDQLAASASASASAAQSAYKGVQTALNNLPDGDTLIINDLTTGGTKAALSAEQGKILGRRPNLNLLDNWFFANPVNQRGQTEYTANGYTVDRWVKAAPGTVTVADGYVTVGSGVTLQASQEADVVSAITGRELTFSVLTDTGLLTGTATFTSAKIFCSDDKIALRISGAGNPYITTTADVNIIAVKLELGDTQTLAHQDANGNWVLNDPPPDKGMELLKCIQSTADTSDAYANKKILHTGNKPSGSYTGNGSATERTIETGGLGNVVAITCTGVLAIIGYHGAIYVQNGTKVAGLDANTVNFRDGILTIKSDSAFNASGAKYVYQVL